MPKNNTKSLGYALSQITRIWNQRFIDILRTSGYYNLKPSFCAVFFPLFDNDGQSASELARATKMTKQTMSTYVRELQKRGYVKISQDVHDKRVRRIFLTVKGALLQKVFAAANLAISQELCGHLAHEESAQLSLLLEKCFYMHRND